MRTIELNAANWKTVLDFCHALLDAIGAPEVHGMSPDAFVDSMIWGGMNAVEPPYAVLVLGLATAPKEVRDYVELVKEALWERRVYRKRHNGDDVEVSIEIARTAGGSEFDGQEARARNTAEIARIEYEGPDPKVRTGIEKIRQKWKLAPGATIKVTAADRSSAMSPLSFTIEPVNSLTGNSMSLQQIDLGKEGLEYVASCLTGELGLCSRLLRQLERVGEVFATVPAETSRERALQFNAGGLMSRGETYAWFERELEQLSGRVENGSLVFQDVWFRPEDPIIGGYDGVFFDLSCVYHVLGPDEINAAAISRSMLRLHSFKMVAVFCDFSFRAADVPTTRILHENLIDAMANNAQEIFVSAYDQEGLVVWRKA